MPNISELLSKSFSNKANAKRALVATGADPAEYEFSEKDGRWFISEAGNQSAQDRPDPDFEPPAFLKGGVTWAEQLPPREEAATEPPTTEPTSVHINDLHKVNHPIAKANAESWRAVTGTKAKDADAGLAFATGADGQALITEFAGDMVELVAAAFRAGIATRKPRTPTERKPRGESKVGVVAALLQRPEGTTTREVLDATGWPSISMPATAKQAGLVLRKEKVDGRTRYYGKV